MQLIDGELLYSATDLNNFLECEHLTQLDRQAALGQLVRPAKSASAELIAGKGIEHEARHLQRLESAYDDVVTIETGSENTLVSLRAAADATIGAMQAGARIIYQGVFLEGRWLGKSDFLLRVETPCERWPWSYEVADTKLALHSKPYFIVQLSFYSEQLARIQGLRPALMHVILGDGREEQHRVEDYRAYYERLKARFERFMEQTQATYPLKVGHCDVCAWDSACKQRRNDDDHLSLVARIRRDQIKKLESADIGTLAALATATLEQRPLSMAEQTFSVLHRQARLQHQGRVSRSHCYEFLDRKEQQGFALLPRPAPGDIFFDMEGDPLFMPGRGLEYLFGIYAPDDTPAFRKFWAHSPVEEKRAFEGFIDYVVARRKAFPQMHIYHYAPYEKVALRRLMSLHSTREQEVDDLLRGEVFVDLYAVVRQALCISQPSYSIKKLEAFYDMQRETETKFGGDSIVMYEHWLQDRARQDILDDIDRYNQDDCRSTWMLREWLLTLRAEAVAAHGEIPWYDKDRPKPLCHEIPDADCKSCRKRTAEAHAQTERAALRTQLLAGLEDVDAFTIAERPDEQRVRWMLAQLLEYHNREQKPVWWAFYDRCENLDSLVHGDSEAVGGLTLCEDIEPFIAKRGERNLTYTYRFPDQQFKLKLGDVFDPETRKSAGELTSVDGETNLVEIKRSAAVHAAKPLRAIIPGGPIQTEAQDRSLERIAQACLRGELQTAYPAIEDVLLRRRPRLQDEGGPPVGASGPMVSDTTLRVRNHTGAVADTGPVPIVQPTYLSTQTLISLVHRLEASYLFVQGPPGSGKSTYAAAVIADLLRSGKRVGVLSNSHQAIHNLLHKVEDTALALAIPFHGLKKAGSDDDSHFVSLLPQPMIESTGSNDAFASPDWQLAAGTAWLFAREELAGKLDYLFIDEAGQIALADTIAVAPCAKNLVLLGDPLQLAQVSQGTHPDGIGASALEHLLGDAATIPPDRGVFLNQSYRMHPSIGDFISRNVYDGRLHSAPQTAQQQVHSPGSLSGSGLRYVAMEHRGNAQESQQEAEYIAGEIASLLLATWTDAQGRTRPLAPDDILVVTPYNAQRRCIQREFTRRNIHGIGVGTVDKFQGKEAAVVFFSMATSSSEELPRNIEFLFSKNRFNVAVSRARCLAVLVASARLLDLRCSTIEQMALTNLLCSFVCEAASQTSQSQASTEQLAFF